MVARRLAILVGLTSLIAACYDYTPLTGVTPQPGTHVALTLSDSGSRGLAPYLGPNVSVVRGRYVRDSVGQLLVQVSSVGTTSGEELSWDGELVALPHRVIAATQVRTLSKHRSVLVVGVGLTAVAAVTAAFVLSGGGARSGTGGGPPSPQ